jgi:hypothetical protein
MVNRMTYEKIKGTLKQYATRESKNGRKYLTLLVDNIFAFYWGKPENLEVTKDNEGDIVEMEYKPGKFVGVVSCKFVESKHKVLTPEVRHDVMKFVADVSDIDAVEEFIKNRDLDPEEILKSLQESGDITIDRRGNVKLLG